MITIKDWKSTAEMDTCIFCDKPVLENQMAASWKRDGKMRTVHADCLPKCAEHGQENVMVDGKMRTRVSPCWPLKGDDENICAYHRWKKNAKPGDMWL